VDHSSAPNGQPSASGPTGEGPDRRFGGVLASTVQETARVIRPGLVALLAVAIILLGLGSLPRVVFADARLNELLARRRTQIASVGAAAFIAVVIAFLIG
jgi:hypothetical protein